MHCQPAEARREPDLGACGRPQVDLHGLHVEEALRVLERHLIALGGLGHPGGTLLQARRALPCHSSAQGMERLLPLSLQRLLPLSLRCAMRCPARPSRRAPCQRAGMLPGNTWREVAKWRQRACLCRRW